MEKTKKVKKIKKLKNTPIGIIGVRAAGKTTYLTVLYKLLQKKKHKYIPSIHNPDAQDYIDTNFIKIKNGESVPPNDPNSPFDNLEIEFLNKNSQITINTFDYAGELAEPRDQEKLIKELSGNRALIVLLPPECIDETNTSVHNSLQTLFKNLADINNKVKTVDFISVVISKSDEVKEKLNISERKIIKKCKDIYSKELNLIDKRCKGYKIFAVSSLGNKYPEKFNPYGVCESFCWLLDKFVWQQKVNKLKRISFKCLIIVFVISCFLGVSKHIINNPNQKKLQSFVNKTQNNQKVNVDKWEEILGKYDSIYNFFEDDNFVKENKALLVELSYTNLQALIEETDDINNKIFRCEKYSKNYPKSKYIQDVKIQLQNLKDQKKMIDNDKNFAAILAKIEREKTSQTRKRIIQKEIQNNKDLTSKQIENLQKRIVKLDNQILKSEWNDIESYIRKNPNEFKTIIDKYEAFQINYPDAAKEKKVHTKIHEWYKKWDDNEYKDIKNTFEKDPLTISGVASLCEQYENENIKNKQYMRKIQAFLDWHESLKTEKLYEVKIEKFVGDKKNKLVRGSKDKILIKVKTSQTDSWKKSVKKKTGENGVAVDFGTITLPWKLGDNIKVFVECYTWKNHNKTKVLEADNTLAYFAGICPVPIYDDGTRVEFSLVNEDDWFKF